MKETLNIFDSLQFLHFENQVAEFPIHYHETYCISLIQEGVLCENKLVAPKNSILISHPFEIHSNKAIGTVGTSFSTFYIAKDVFNYISPFEHTSFQNKVIENQFMTDLFVQLIGDVVASKQKKQALIKLYTNFYHLIFELAKNYGSDTKYETAKQSIPLDEITGYIANNLISKIDLSSLAKILGKNKFQFIRWFKSQVGLTPFEYVMLKRVELGMKLIQQGMPLVHASLDSGFYDQSHFTNYFKKYVGVTPNVYRSTCNIFQEN